MTTLSYDVPVPAMTLNSVADPQIATALTAILTWANDGNIDAANLSAALAQAATVNQAGQTVKGASVVAASQTTSSTTYTTLSTPDQITGLVVPANGLIRVWYAATWQESVAGAARAAFFVGSSQLKTAALNISNSPVTQAAATGNTNDAGSNQILASYPAGLLCPDIAGSGSYSGDVTTGMAAVSTSAPTIELNGTVEQSILATPIGFGGPCDIDNLSAGTYTVSVEFKTSSGSVTASTVDSGRR